AAGGAAERASTAAWRRSIPIASRISSPRISRASASPAPAWRATSKDLPSCASAGESQPASTRVRFVWADGETGSSSAGPWASPSATAWPSRSAGATAGATSGRVDGASRAESLLGKASRAGGAAPAAAEDQVRDRADDERQKRVVDVLEGRPRALPVAAERVAGEREGEHPWERADEREHREAHDRHPRDAGGQGDECPDEGDHPAEQNDRLAPALKPTVGALDLGWTHVELATVAFEQLQAPGATDPVGHPGADERPQQPREDDAGHRHVVMGAAGGVVGDREAGEQHHHL